MLKQVGLLLLQRGLIVFTGISITQVWWWPDEPPWLLLLGIAGSVCTADFFYLAALRRIEPRRQHRARRRIARRSSEAIRPPQGRPFLGRALARTGAALHVATSFMWAYGSLGVMVGILAVQSDKINYDNRGYFLLSHGSLATGLLCFVTGRFAARRGRRYTTRVIHDPVDVKNFPYVLYLRAFDDDLPAHRMPFTTARGTWNPLLALATDGPVMPSDLTLEEEVTSLFGSLGRVVAVGIPGEALAFGGADRMYLPRSNWKPVVSELIRDAQLVVLAASTTEGTLWELAEACRLLPRARLVVLLYGDEQRYEDFRAAVAGEFGSRGRFPFPGPPPSSLDGPPGPMLWGAVRFLADGSAQCKRFDQPLEVSLFLNATSRREVYLSALEGFVRDIAEDLKLLGDPASCHCPAGPRYDRRLLPSPPVGTVQGRCTVCGRSWRIGRA